MWPLWQNGEYCMINVAKFEFDDARFLSILNRQTGIPTHVTKTVERVLDDVKNNGDVALKKYMKEYDGIDLDVVDVWVSEEEFENAKKNISPSLAESIKKACDNIIKYHQEQIPQGYKVNYENDVVLERKYRPLNRVGVTVPGDMAPLLSTLYMNLIPAIVAGVPEIYVISKPKNGKINDCLLFVADYLNVKKVLKISGSQGIAALAYGTEMIPKVDAIVGPGNNYTQVAKKLLYGTVRIDSLAGPSEIAIIADDSANPTFIAADLLSQAEHGTGFEASTVFCMDFEQAERIKAEVERLIVENELESARKSLENYGDIFVVDSIDVAVEAVNKIAPEHVELVVRESDKYVSKIVNAGAIFVGEYSTEPVGDYFCGTNHVLPTCGTARFSSGLNVLDFMRGYSVINYSRSALQSNGAHIMELASTEGLKAHSLAVKVRVK